MKANSTIGIVDDFIAPFCDGFVETLYQDDDILLINKPSGLLSLSGKNPRNKDSVHYRLVHGQKGVTPAFPKAKLPHRLDFGTSGIMLVSLNEKAARQLNKQFQSRQIRKTYLAILSGWLTSQEGAFSAPIAKDKNCFPKVKICQITGKEAVSEYLVLKRLEHPRRCIVKYTPHTGRTHQLRIHSLAMGHPILGCDLYKNDKSEEMSERLLLHASELFFEHPISGKKMHVACPCPF
jgi:tRNA pseudouridine32 synthase / 23S rRNA pseudouridine746 synthase